MKLSKLALSLLIAISFSFGSSLSLAATTLPTGLQVIATAQASLNGFTGSMLASKVSTLKSNGTPISAIAAAMLNLTVSYTDAKQALINGAGLTDAQAQSELVAAGYSVPTDSAASSAGGGGASFGSIATTGGGSGGGGGTVSPTN